MPLAAPCPATWKPAMQLLKLAERYLDKGEAAKAAQALAKAGRSWVPPRGEVAGIVGSRFRPGRRSRVTISACEVAG
jgi:hypothetical protein